MTLTTQDDFSRQLAEFDKIQDTCKKLLQTKHYQALGEAGIHAVMARAKALGIHPFEALNGGFTCIQGKVGMSTEMMAALVRQRGHSITKDPKSTSECVILHGKRKDNGDTWTCSFSKEDAIAAGLWNGPTWKKYPGIMLYNRCMSMLFRQLFPDLSLGAGYVEDELKEITKTGDYSKPENLLVSDCEIIKEDPKKLENMEVVEKITAAQAEELRLLSSGVPQDIKNNVKTTLQKMNLASMKDLPATSFAYFYDLLLKNQETVSEEEMIDE